MSVRIIGTGSYLPKKVADNNFLSTIVDTDDEWIRQRTGIKERHLSNGKEGTTIWLLMRQRLHWKMQG